MTKTKPNDIDPRTFLETIVPEQRREDAQTLLSLYSEISGLTPRIWGRNIIGFGEYHYKYDSRREGIWMRGGFSPQKAQLSLYIMADFPEKAALLNKLGPHKTGRACLYITRLARIDISVLRQIIALSFQEMARRYPD